MRPSRRSRRTVLRAAAKSVSAVLGFLALALHGAPLEAGSDLDHPGAVTAPAAAPAAGAAQPAPFDPLAMDPLELSISYYHANPEPERLPETLRALVARGAFAPTSPRAREHLRFFAAAAATDPAALAAIRKAGEAGSGQEKALLLAVAAKAGYYAPPVVEAPDDIAQLWAEYQATGAEAGIKAVIALVGLPESADPNGLAKAAASSLLRAGDQETARRELDLLGEDRDPGVWGGLTALKKAQREMAAR